MPTKNEAINELVYIQSNLKAPKSQFNSFGNYKYRSCEDILEAVKPLLKEVNCVLTISDDIVVIADRIYVKAIATLETPNGHSYVNFAFAREPMAKKGMDESQVTGMASSYARKYALNGLFCIDDTRDADSYNNGDSTKPSPKKPVEIKAEAPATPQEAANMNPSGEADIQMSLQLIAAVNACNSMDELTALKNNQLEPIKSSKKLATLLNARYKAITAQK